MADGTYAGVDDFDDAKDYYADVKARAAALGRDPDQIHLLPGLTPVIAGTDEEARAIAEAQRGKLDESKLLVQLAKAGRSATTTSPNTRATRRSPTSRTSA